MGPRSNWLARALAVECQVVEGVLFGSFLGVLFGLLGFSQWLIKDRHFLADDEILFIAFGGDDRNLLHLECDRRRVLNVSCAYTFECGLIGMFDPFQLVKHIAVGELGNRTEQGLPLFVSCER